MSRFPTVPGRKQPDDPVKKFLHALIPFCPLSDLPAYLCQQDTAKHIYDIMLLCHLSGNADQDSKNKRKSLIPGWNLFLFPDSHIAEPAYQTVNGRKQIRRLINRINQFQDLFP